MRKIIITTEIPQKIIESDFLEVKDTQYALFNKPMYINAIDGNLTNKDIQLFLKNSNNPNLLMFTKRKPNKRILAYFDKKIKVLNKSNKLGFTDIYKIYNRKISYDEKVALFRRTSVAPHIILKTIVSSTRNIKLINALVELEKCGFPTYESITAVINNNV